jgi:hypothetical protein
MKGFHTGLLEKLFLQTPQELDSVFIRAPSEGGSEETVAVRKQLASFDISSSRVTNYVSYKEKYLKLLALPKSLFLVSFSQDTRQNTADRAKSSLSLVAATRQKDAWARTEDGGSDNEVAVLLHAQSIVTVCLVCNEPPTNAHHINYVIINLSD